MHFFKRIKYKLEWELNRYKIISLRKKYFLRYKNSERLILILVPNDDDINGGTLSLVSIYNEISLLSNLHHCDVIASTYPYNSTEYFIKFSKFKNNMVVFDLKMVLKNIKKLKELHIYIPELFLKEFIVSFENQWTQNDRRNLLNSDLLHINILNQNDLFMPEQKYIEIIKKNITSNVTMTVAHKKYATICKRDSYQIPLHYLSAWINSEPYHFKNFNEKENIILFSPDELARLNMKSNFTKEELIDIIRKEFPRFEVIIIKNLKYDDYKELVSRSKFTITLGEGLDGYFVENVLSGGISFAVYNDKFFTSDYKELPTVYSSLDELIEKINSHIHFYNREDEFESYNKIQKDIVEIEYSYEKYKKRVETFIKGEYDFL